MTTTTPRVKTISKTLEEVRASHRFYKVTYDTKTKQFGTSRIQINGHKAVWAKDQKVVYSPATGLAGHEENIIDFLKFRADDKSDSSAEEVLKQFRADKGLITFKNHEKHSDYIADKTRDRQKATDSEGHGKISLIPRERIPDLLTRVREVRGQVSSSGKASRADVIAQYLEKVKEGKIVRIHGCTQEGLSPEGKLLRSTTKDGTSVKGSVALSNAAPLSHFVVPTSYENKRYVYNFMTLYYMHVDSMKMADAQSKARVFAEDLLSQYKKARGGRTAAAGRSSSRSSSRKSRAASSDSGARSSSRKASKSPKSHPTVDGASPTAQDSPTSAASPKRGRSVSKSRGRSQSRAKSQSKAKARSDSTVQSAGSSRQRAATPTRSPSPSASPKAVKAKVFRLPSKKPQS
jgi:hypothetical protein